MNPPSESSILFQNPDNSVFLIDIPSSIALAQDLSPTQHPNHPQLPQRKNNKKSLLSSLPLKTPYPSPNEPKSEAKRAKILQSISPTERTYHFDLIEPLVRTGLAEIRDGCQDVWNWCRWRYVAESDQEEGEYPKRRRLDEDSADKSMPVDDTQTEVQQDEVIPQCESSSEGPPIILSPTSVNEFESLSELRDQTTKNTSLEPATLRVGRGAHCSFYIPPLSTFVLCTLPISQSSEPIPEPIPGLGNKKFNLILLDPPWPNRSVRRGRQYHTNAYFDVDTLTLRIRDILQAHLYDHSTDREVGNGVSNPEGRRIPSQQSLAAIWVTNAEKSRKSAYDAIHGAGLEIVEEWVWVKTALKGEPVTPLDGLWRKPYEILVIGKKPVSREDGDIGDVTRRVIAGVPDIHSRKPNLTQIFERIFFTSTSSLEDGAFSGSISYSALEVFARNLTAGWWACGDEVLKFSSEEWWVDQ